MNYFFIIEKYLADKRRANDLHGQDQHFHPLAIEFLKIARNYYQENSFQWSITYPRLVPEIYKTRIIGIKKRILPQSLARFSHGLFEPFCKNRYKGYIEGLLAQADWETLDYALQYYHYAILLPMKMQSGDPLVDAIREQLRTGL